MAETTAPGTTAPGRTAGTMLLGQVRYANRGFWRTPVSAFFTLVFPLTFLVILSAIYGNEVVDPATGLRLAQFTTPAFAVFGACMACYSSLALAVAYARESGVLKRLRGTPLPPRVHLAGRILSAIWVSMIAVVIMVAVGVAFYRVRIIAENMPALLLSLLVGMACFAALGLAVAAVAPTPSAAQAFSNGSLILLSFISGVFAVGQLPEWMDRLATIFPLKHFVDAVAPAFNPYVDAATPRWADLAVMVVWGLAGVLVAARAFRWEPTPGRVLTHGRRAKPVPAVEPGVEGLRETAGEEAASAEDVATWGQRAASGAPTGTGTVQHGSPPSVAALVAGQTRYAVLQIRRDAMSLFFAVLFPVLLVVFFSSVYGEEARWAGLPLAQYMAAAFAVYGIATSGLVNLPGSIADHRAHRILTRLRGTPLPPWAYLAGRVLASLIVGLLTVGLVFGASIAFLSVKLPPPTWAATLLTFLLSIACFAACGLALVSLVSAPQAVVATALTILLPLSFVSDIFIAVEQMPTVLNAVGWTFPLRHAVAAAVTATSGQVLDQTFWGHLGVIMLWTGIGLLLARLRFHWEPRRGATH